MQVEIIRDLNGLLAIKEYWKEIENDNKEITYYSTFDYNYNWCKNYIDDKNRLFIIVVYNNKKIIGIAPLMLEERKKLKIRYNILKFIGKGDFFNFIIDKRFGNELSIIKEIFKTIENTNEWDKIILTQVSQFSKLAEYIFRHDIYNNSFSPIVECPCVYLDNFKDFNEYKKAYKIDKDCRYYLNRLKKDVNFKFSVVNNVEKDLYEKLKSLHIKEQEYLKKQKARSERGSVFEGEKNNKFFTEIFTKNNNNITFLIEDENENIISYYNCYIFNGRIHFWNTGYNCDYIKYTPSKIVNFLLFEYLYENNMTEYTFDFGAGRYPWKFKWTDKFNMIYKLEFINKKTRKGKILNKLSK